MISPGFLVPCDRILRTRAQRIGGKKLVWKIPQRASSENLSVVWFKKEELPFTPSRMEPVMYRRDSRNRGSLFDSLEEGGHRPTSPFSSNEIAEHENERGVSVLQDRVSLLKMMTADIHDEVNGHNRLLERMEQDMDSSRGVLGATMGRFKRMAVMFGLLGYENFIHCFKIAKSGLTCCSSVFETKSGRHIFTTVAALVIVFLLVYYLLK